MTVQRRDGDRWLPAEPMPEPFGIVWGRFWKFRRDRGERSLPALVRSLFDTKAVS